MLQLAPFAPAGLRAILKVVACLCLAAVAGAAGYRIGYGFGHTAGYASGKADAERTARLNDKTRELAEAQRDLDAAQATAARLRETQASNERALKQTARLLETYRANLAKRPNGGCALSDDDVGFLRPNRWRDGDGADAAPAPGR